jgi:hypothetical protein
MNYNFLSQLFPFAHMSQSTETNTNTVSCHLTAGRAMAQAVCQLLTAEAWVESQASPCGI